MEEEAKDVMEASVDGILGTLGPMVDPFLNEVANSLRLVYLTVTWPRGRYYQSASFSRLVTTRDYSFAPLVDEMTQSMDNSSQNSGGNKWKNVLKIWQQIKALP